MQRVRCAAARRVTTAHSRTSLPQKLSLSPISAPSGGVSGSTTVCSSFDAHRSMPNDLMPRMLRGYVWHGRGRERAQGRAAARVSLPRVVAPSATTQAPSQRQRAVPGGTFGAPSRCQALLSPPCHPFLRASFVLAGLGLDSHLEVCEHEHVAPQQLVLIAVLDEAADDGARLLLAHVHRLHVEA